MKRALPVYLMLFFAAAPAVHAAFYQWTDADGVVHFTDNPKQIPAKYRKKAKKVKMSEEPSAVRVESGAQAPPPPPPAPPQQPADRGGHPEQWWRGRFLAFRNQILGMQDQLAQKQAKLTELRRKRVIYQRARDREAVNAMESEIAADEARLAELQKGLEKFDLEAAMAGVPPNWRR